MEEKRIFVHGLPKIVGQEEIKSLFSEYGTVIDISIPKTKGLNSSMAFVTLQAPPSDINDCIFFKNNSSYKGSILKVEAARESFLDRLQKEREAQKDKQSNPKTEILENGNSFKVPKRSVESYVHHKGDSEKSFCQRKEMKNSFTRQETIENKKERKKSHHKEVTAQNESCLNTSEERSYVKSNIYQKTDEENDSLKDNSKRKGKDKEKSDNKRLASLDLQHKLFLERKAAVSLALNSLDSKTAVNKKITFAFEDDFGETNAALSEVTTTKPSRDLFDDDKDYTDETKHSEFSEYFSLKPQFEGSAGEKLFNLQSTYNSDPRFKLDERFIEDHDPEAETVLEGNEMDMDNEKQRSISILEKVLGHEISNKHVKKAPRKNYIIDLSRMRYDPMQSDAEKFILKQKIEEKSKEKNIKKNPEKTIQEAPKVTDERFYAVSDKLKNTLGTTETANSETFSLLKTFGSNVAENNKPEVPKSDRISDNFFKNNLSAHKQRDQLFNHDRNRNVKGVKRNRKVGKSKPQNFFILDKSVLQEGVSFFSSTTGTKSNEEVAEEMANIKKFLREKKRRNTRRKPIYMKKKKFVT